LILDLEWDLPTLYLGLLGTLVLALLVACLAYRLGSRLDLLAARWPLRATPWLLVSLIIAYILVFGGLSLLRHEAFHSKGYDLGIFSQVVWNSARGQLYQTTLYPNACSNFLGVHFAPILALLAPLYWLFPDARVLLIAQTIALALGVLPIYWLARQRPGPPFPLLFALAYFLLPSLHFVNLFDFHPIALVIPLLAFATYGLLQHRYWLFATFLGLALLCQEEVAFIAVGLGLYLLLVQRRPAGAGLAVCGLLWGYALISWVIPTLGFGMAQGEYSFLVRYGYLGDNVGEIIQTLLTQPLHVLERVWTEPRLRFTLHHLVSFGFTPLAGLEVLALAGIPLTYLLLSAYDPMYSLQWHYTAPVTPFVALAAVVGCARLLQRWPSSSCRWALAGFVLTMSLGHYMFVSPGPLGAYFDPDLYDITAPRAVAARAALALIPANSPVMAQSNLVPHLSERPLVRLYPETPDLNEVDYVVCDPTGHIYGFLSHESLYLNMERLDINPYYERIFDQDGIIVFRRRDFTPSVVQRVNFGDVLTLPGYDLTADGSTLRVTLYWRSLRRLETHYKYFVHLVDHDGKLIAQDDREPGNWRYPMTDWMPGETVPERYAFVLPAGVNPHDCRLRVGVYATETGERLSFQGTDGTPWTELWLDWPP